jgi:hypothetical protein
MPRKHILTLKQLVTKPTYFAINYQEHHQYSVQDHKISNPKCL